METHTINGKEVEIYTSIDSLPAGRYHQFNRYLLIDSHIGGNIEAVSRHVDKIALLLKKGRTEEAALTLRNMQQTMAFIIQNLDPGLLAFTPLIKSIDGVQVEALTDEQAQALVAQLTTPAAPVGFWRSLIARIKKKIDDELSLLYPKLSSGTSRRIFSELKTMAYAYLQEITTGEDKSATIASVEDYLLDLNKPRIFWGPQGVEASFIRSFNLLCVTLGKYLNTDPRKVPVSQFMAAVFLIQEEKKALTPITSKKRSR